MVIAFAFVFATARPLVGAVGALVAVLIIDGMHYFQYTAVKFNHDVVQLPFWALAGYAFHAALKRGRARALAPARHGASAARYGRNISSSCWRRPMRCSCCSTAGAARFRDAGPVARARRRAGRRCAACRLAVPDRFPAVCLCQPSRRAGARLVRSYPASCGIRRRARFSFCCRRCSSPRRCFGRSPKQLPSPSPADSRCRRFRSPHRDAPRLRPGLAMIALTA